MTNKEILLKLLSDYGISAEFNYNLKHYGRPDVQTIDQLFAFIKRSRLKVKNLFFVAFYWSADVRHNRGSKYWGRISDEFRRRLNEPKGSI